MTTDPRLAPLAAALKAAFTEKPYEYADGHVAPILRDDAAAAILAVLPPDWCGHSLTAIEELMDEIEKREVEIATLRAVLDGLMDAIETWGYDGTVTASMHLMDALATAKEAL